MPLTLPGGREIADSERTRCVDFYLFAWYNKRTCRGGLSVFHGKPDYNSSRDRFSPSRQPVKATLAGAIRRCEGLFA